MPISLQFCFYFGNISEAGCETPVISHGYVSVRNRSFALGQQIEVKCKGGYRLPSTKLTVLHLVCQSQRTWTDLFGNTRLPTCESKLARNSMFLISMLCYTRINLCSHIDHELIYKNELNASRFLQ